MRVEAPTRKEGAKVPKRISQLSESTIRHAKPKESDYKIFDGGGLYLLVTKGGSKLWHLKYRFEGKEKKLSIGAYPGISLADARAKREEARAHLANGIDPIVRKQAIKEAALAQAETFEIVAREWYTKFAPSWTENHAAIIMSRMKRDLFPWLGSRPIAEIRAPELLKALRRVESRGALETARRDRIIAGQIFRYAVATGRAERDCASDLKGALPPSVERHHAAIIDPKEVAPLLRAIDGYKGHFIVKCALRLAPLVFVRPGELRRAEWSEFDLDQGLWSIPAEKMKMKHPHIVPLSDQTLEILKELKPLTGSSQYVFPGSRSFAKPISENALLAALRYLGYDKDTMTPHGFRAMARTLLDEVLQIRPDVIEHQLAHAVKDPNGRSYNRTTHLEARCHMMQLWADYLDGLKKGAKVLTISKKRA